MSCTVTRLPAEQLSWSGAPSPRLLQTPVSGGAGALGLSLVGAGPCPHADKVLVPTLRGSSCTERLVGPEQVAVLWHGMCRCQWTRYSPGTLCPHKGPCVPSHVWSRSVVVGSVGSWPKPAQLKAGRETDNSPFTDHQFC